MTRLRWAFIFAICALLTACATGTKLRPLEARAPSQAEPPARPAQGSTYQINSDSSWIKVLAFRSGALANLGHNHVIRFGGLSGEIVLLDGQLNAGWLAMRLDVTRVVIDDAEDRAEAGPRFDTEPSSKDIDGTRANMLGNQVLAAADFPQIEINSLATSLAAEQLMVDLSVKLRAITREITVPVQVQFASERLQATSQFALSQEQLGLEPFSVLGGALAVADVLEFEIYIEAE